ncbi:MAG TPA: DUF1849 family protein [Reyranella sp.]|nr:DUF1849 family protein [Reyranella sp.]
MRGSVCLLFAAVLAWPLGAVAQVQPHHAQYILRLGPAPNAPRIGTATQDLTADCSGWHLKRDISTEIAITQSWKMSVGSRLDGEEQRGGNAFRYRLAQIQNGNEREVRGRVQHAGKETHAEIVWPDGPQQLILPGMTMMPVSAISHMIARLREGVDAFPALTFDAEVVGDAFLVDVEQLDAGSIRPRRPVDAKITPPGRSWPVHMSFTRGSRQDQKPLFAVNTLVYESGVLDRLTVDTGLVNVTADLQSLKMYDPPSCPRS